LRLLPRRALVALVLCLSFVAAAAAPASASYAPNDSLRAQQRPRAGANDWVPNTVSFNSWWDYNNDHASMEFGFQWDGYRDKLDLGGSQQYFEMNAEVDCVWAANKYGNDPSTDPGEGYDWHTWATNVPNAALPYEDTIFGEPCAGSGGSRGKFGVGVLNVAALVPGNYYWIRVGMNRYQAGGYHAASSNVDLRVGTGTVYDASPGFGEPPQLSNDCSFSDSEIATWSDYSQARQDTRLQASWCAWKDWVSVVSRNDGLTTSTEYDLYTHGLFNKNMETDSAISGWGFSADNGGYANRVRYCNDPFPAFEGSCFVEFNNSNGGMAVMYQDGVGQGSPGAKVNDYPTGEATLRCRKFGGCNVTLGIYALGGNTEYVNVNTWIPNDNLWYVCRLDYNHVSSSLDADGTNGLNFNHSYLQFGIYNYSGGNLDVDAAFVSTKKTEVVDPSPNGHPSGVTDIGAGNTCTQRY
jgi:hypothetical protein